MAKEKTIGDCALCRMKNVELRQSHIVPKLVYNRLKSYKKSQFRNFFNIKEIFQDGEKKPMLCQVCETFFNYYETEFANRFLDIYLASPSEALPNEDIDFYILTVAWRIIYNDLHIFNSFLGKSERSCFEEFENKLGNCIYEKYIEKNPTVANARTIVYEPNIEGKCLGELIAELEKWEKSKSPEDMSEIKNYIYTLDDLGFEDTVDNFFGSMIFGYSFYDSTRTKFYIISGYAGLIFTTVFSRKRSIVITDDRTLFGKAHNSEKIIKENICEELIHLLTEISCQNPKVQDELDKNGLREKISKRYDDNKNKQCGQKPND